MTLPAVRLERGGISLNAIVCGAAAILLNPLNASIASLGVSLRGMRRGAFPMLANGLLTALGACLSSSVAIGFRTDHDVSLLGRTVVVLTFFVANWALTASMIGVRGGESPLEVLRHNLTLAFGLAFGYFGLAALLISYVLDGSIRGYFLTSIVCVLSFALTDTMAGRRARIVLESELSDADRHLVHSRAVEGVVHNLRNHMATALAYLKEIDARRLDSVDRENLETATDAANDAVTVLRSLAQGATPKVSYSPAPVDLNDLATRAVGLARPRARGKEVQIATRESPADVKVKADPLLMREVLTNLLNNAIDAVGSGGKVEVTTCRRPNGSPFVAIADNGPGIPEEHRHHLFEPHFTTKEGGTGLGLFMSYGIVREHQGQLVYEGTRRGAVFTVVLPPFAG
jgi:signal transduction histidine kinase